MTDEIKPLDAIEGIRARPDFYRGPGGAYASKLACRIVEDILIVTESAVIAQRLGDWWIIASSEDWLHKFSPDLDTYFSRVTAFPEYRVNAMHSEVLLSAFARDVIVFDETNCQIIKGGADSAGRVIELRRAHPEWKRLVAFRMP